ncbi:MAG: hypothetical protein WCP70_14215 [Methanothrix sp.]
MSDARLQLAPGIEVGYVMRDAKKWEEDTERDDSEFDAEYYERLLGGGLGFSGDRIKIKVSRKYLYSKHQF